MVSDIYVGDDNKLHKVIGGADTVLPFSKGVTQGTVLNDQKYLPYTHTVSEDANYTIIVAVYSGTPIVQVDSATKGYAKLYQEGSPIYNHYYYLLGKLKKGQKVTLSKSSGASAHYYMFKG